MELTNHHSLDSNNTEDTSESEIPTKAKSDLRESYEAQAQMIQNKIGDLEAVRSRLGLSARKMCQLLLVDPSSWTRWRRGENPPPHIWQALNWLVQIYEMRLNQAKPSEYGSLGFSTAEASPVALITSTPLHRNSEALDAKLNAVHEQGSQLHQKNAELEGKIELLESAVRANRMTAITLGLSTLILAFAFYRALKA